MKKILTSFLFLVVMAIVAACGSDSSSTDSSGENGEAAASNYPERNITNIVPFSAGGTTDVNQRLIEKHWKDYFDTNMVIEYRTGAGGEVGFTELNNADPNGYTMGSINTPHIILQPLGRPTEFDYNTFEVIARLVNDPQVLAVRHDSRFNSLEEFIAELKEKPGSLTVGLTGTLTGDHLTILKFMSIAGVKVTEVPLPGAADQVAQLMGGHIDAIMGNVGDVAKDPDNYKVLGVATEERHEWLPDAPTFKEQGIDLVAAIERGLAFPKGTPKEAVDMVYEALEQIVALPEYQEGMKNAGLVDGFMHGDEWAESIEQQHEEAKVILEEFGLLDQ
ncbi:tripartite tricarboxylate transporter substrate binding protein [Anaerobacillus sp. MEB173]|uniref:tripartite tricarboxylate transporter substrate binding protein n=1 Tax=Anaerobacillus sp. MEB173 TaxID=3383345 RepID=UPI003F90F151